jgi:hypothetical protein
MGKLTLRLDELEVDSFDTTAAERGRGTVFGEQCTCDTQCTCPGCPTCDITCPATCGGSCDSCADTCVPCNNSNHGTCDKSCQLSCYGATCQGW